MENNTNQNETLYQAIKTRIVNYVANHAITTSLSLIGRAFAIFFTFILVLAFCVNPDYAMLCLMHGLLWREAFLVKVAFALYAAARMPRVVRYFYALWDDVHILPRPAKAGSLGRFEGVDIAGLIRVLTSGNHFSRDYVRGELDISVKQHERLQDLFEEVGILVVGDDNARDLHPDYSEKDLILLFEKCRSANKMRAMCSKRDGLRWVVEDTRVPVRIIRGQE